MRRRVFRRTLGMCGRMGPGDGARVAAMSSVLGGVRSLVDEPGGALRADAGAVRWTSADLTAVSWSPTPLPDTLPPDAAEIAERHDAFSLVVDRAGSVRLHSGVSGAVPIYVELDSDPRAGFHFASRVDPLVQSRDRPVRPDWHAWAHILSTGGPLEGRTTFAGIRRLLPWTRISMTGGKPVMSTTGWPWPEIDVSADASSGAVLDALQDTVAKLDAIEPLSSMLSGGWDSRLLAALAARVRADAGDELVAWTTSSDTGTVLEELVAAKVAGHLGARHEVVMPRRDEFAADVDHFVRAVDYQTSFHVWLVPLAKAVAGKPLTLLDGLGGGLFVGDAFYDEDPADIAGRPVLDARFDRLARYLHGAAEVLHPRVVAQIRDRTRESFEAVAKPLADHPFASTFTAYLTRTLPGISLAPYGLMATAVPVATPFLANDVVHAGLALAPERHAGGRLYPELMRALDEQLADLPTALDLTPQVRRHPRRVSSPEAAQFFRDLLLREPVRELLAPEFAAADLGTWQRLLDQTRPQHLIRSLATLSLWLQRYEDVLEGAGVDELMRPAD